MSAINIYQDVNNLLVMTINPCEIQSDTTTGQIATFDPIFAPTQPILYLVYSKYQQIYPIVINPDGTICMIGQYIGFIFSIDICQVYTWKNPIAEFNLIDDVEFLNH